MGCRCTCTKVKTKRQRESRKDLALVEAKFQEHIEVLLAVDTEYVFDKERERFIEEMNKHLKTIDSLDDESQVNYKLSLTERSISKRLALSLLFLSSFINTLVELKD